ncbi:MAG: methyl-accepting chemotaxis protein [Prosthecobacter sp.]|uniref:methyl-accepting chemotaxis protein n=1 Tax=Prosthecobacter sp. TaxID=1965333 RepID=UPI0039010D32
MRWFINLKTSSKLTTGFGIVILVLVAVIITAWTSMYAVRDAEISIADAMSLRNNFNGQRSALLAAILQPAGTEVESKLQEVHGYSSDNTEVLKRLDALYRRDAEMLPYVEQITSIRMEFVQVRDTEVIPLIRQQKKEEAATLVLGPQSERFEKIRTISREFTQVLTERSRARLAQAQVVFGILSGCAVLTAILMIVGLGRLIAQPLEKIAVAADKIANGDLNVEFTGVDRGDEVGALMKTFQRMTQSLSVLSDRARQIADGDLTAQITPRSERDVLGNAFANMLAGLRRIMQELLEAVNVLASSASEIMASTTQLAAGAAETAAAITETTATVEEVKQTSQISSQKAKSVAEESQKAADVARGGKRAVDQTIEGMGGIRQQMGLVAESILSLSAQGQAIGEIIATVDDLAAQSKLLAVSAAIEAARAGEEGKGFSVVAQEVKSLAEQSKQATTQVRAILNDIQKATSSAVLATEQGSKAVEAGVRQSNSAGESISALSGNIAEAAQAATQIAATNQQQFVGMDQVALAMENIKIASTQTVTSTKQAETAAQQLHDLGQKLKQLVARFKV